MDWNGLEWNGERMHFAFVHSQLEEMIMTTSPVKTLDGTVVGVTGDTLTTTCGDGKQHSHTVTKDAKVTCDGKASKTADLKVGTPVRVTPHKDDKSKATAVESGKHIAAPMTPAMKL